MNISYNCSSLKFDQRAYKVQKSPNSDEWQLRVCSQRGPCHLFPNAASELCTNKTHTVTQTDATTSRFPSAIV